MNKYLVLANLIILSCSKSEDDSSSYSTDIKNNDINQSVNSGNIYFENETCKCPNALNGDKDVISGITYTAVDNSTIKDEIAKGNIYLCTTLVTDMSGTSVSNTFQNFFNNTSFNSNISFWDVSNVINMDGMFFNADLFNQDISSWDTSKVENMGSLFKNASSFNQSISGWNTSKVTKMLDLFRGARTFNQDISNWDTVNVNSMSNMFNGATSFNQDISSWCVSNFSFEPDNFSTNSPLIDSYKPIWGNCPE